MSAFNFTPSQYSSSLKVDPRIPISPKKKSTTVRRTNSLPLVYKSNSLKRTLSNPLENRRITREGITFGKRDETVNTFAANLSSYAEQANQEGIYTADNIRKGDVNFYYFIGRLNPTHEGHLSALYTLVKMARSNGACALILLGSGPGRARTMDNPLDFATKADFIRRKLTQAGYIDGTNFVIQEMTNPAADVSTHILSRLDGRVNDPSTETINITHVAGGKDDDANKLKFALNQGQKTAKISRPAAKVSGQVKTIIPISSKIGKAMSATQVRIDAYKTLIPEYGFSRDMWFTRYGRFYGINADAIYNQIVEIANRDGIPAIRAYITSKSGGSKTKRRRTQRKKRRITRRK